MFTAFVLFFHSVDTNPSLLKRSHIEVYGKDKTSRVYKGDKFQNTLFPTENKVFIYVCIFYKCSSTSNGGAISCGSSVYELVVEQTFIDTCCTSNSLGGGIYFNNVGDSECTLIGVCGFNCTSTKDSFRGLFASITVGRFFNRNHVNDTTISHSSSGNLNSLYTLHLTHGLILCHSVNLTKNICSTHCALYCSPKESKLSYLSQISYSSIVNNTASISYGCISIAVSDSSHRIDRCNILNNKQKSSEGGTIYSIAKLLVKDSCILGNNENNNVFVSSDSGSIAVVDCTIDDDILKKQRYIGNIAVFNMIESEFINPLSHIVLYVCNSSFDSYGTLTVKVVVPTEKSRCLLSCNCNFRGLSGYKLLLF
jgi:hypothetical protein